MNHASCTAHIENLVDELIALYLAQTADLREYVQAAVAGEGTVHLERTLRHREVQRAALYRQFEAAVFPVLPLPYLADQIYAGEWEIWATDVPKHSSKLVGQALQWRSWWSLCKYRRAARLARHDDIQQICCGYLS